MRNISDIRNARPVFALMTLIHLAAISGCQQSGDFSSGSDKLPARKTPAPISEKNTTKPTPAIPPMPQPTVPPQAITQGSFTVWADPAKPLAMEPYAIHVLVKLAQPTPAYNRFDLSGTLFGTDGYTQQINGKYAHLAQDFSTANGYAKLIMHVPGAEFAGISDTLDVTSALLSETQSIRIVFQ